METLAIHRIGLQKNSTGQIVQLVIFHTGGVIQRSAFNILHRKQVQPRATLLDQTNDSEQAGEDGQAAVCERATDSGAGAARGGRSGGGGARGGGDRRTRGGRRRGGGRRGTDGRRRRDRGRAEHRPHK